MGLNLWDIRFKDDRIIYELTPQEAMAQYSGLDPRQSSTVYLDRAFGMGAAGKPGAGASPLMPAVKELIVGYDCPDEAVYLPATVHLAGGSSTRLNAICVFERDSGRPLSRHTGWLPDEMGAVKGFELTVRSVSTVGWENPRHSLCPLLRMPSRNYDYIVCEVDEVMLKSRSLTMVSTSTVPLRYEVSVTSKSLRLTITLPVSASGYLQGGFWHEEYSPYGHSIRETTM